MMGRARNCTGTVCTKLFDQLCMGLFSYLPFHRLLLIYLAICARCKHKTGHKSDCKCTCKLPPHTHARARARVCKRKVGTCEHTHVNATKCIITWRLVMSIMRHFISGRDRKYLCNMSEITTFEKSTLVMWRNPAS
jgi:hypothetical protein